MLIQKCIKLHVVHKGAAVLANMTTETETVTEELHQTTKSS